LTSPRQLPRSIGAAELLRSVGLMADGPVTWGRPVPSGRPGVYIVEWPESRAEAPVELTLVGKWLERLPTIRLDGERPTSRAVAARLHDFWLPGQTVVYVGATPASIGGRVGALYRTPLGDRKPHAGGQWLQTLRGLDRARVWWAVTDAPEEYEDALFSAFAGAVDSSPEAAPRLPDRSVILPFANLQTATGARKAHGLTGTLEPRPAELPVPGTTVVDVPDGTADGAVESGLGRPLERRTTQTPPRPAVAPRATAPASVSVAEDATAESEAGASAGSATSAALKGPAARVDLVLLNDALQTIACRRLVRELTVSEAVDELAARGFLRETRAQPVSVLRDLLKQNLIEGGVQDADRRWSIRCVRAR
jgi:hypothetical protein